jgi:thiamine-phosphate diphosphorylase
MRSILVCTLVFLLSLLRRSEAWFIDRPAGSKQQRDCTKLRESVISDSSSSTFPRSDPPYLAVITETSACESDECVEATLNALHRAVSEKGVDLISVRVPSSDQDEYKSRVVKLTRQLVEWSASYNFRVVLSSDWIDVALLAKAHGIHVKESHRDLIPEIRKRFKHSPALIGTSAHSLESIRTAWKVYRPDYFFVGTCYETKSHPEKVELEGPELPGQACRELAKLCDSTEQRPPVLAIGGIDERNCHEPVLRYGADGVATIRAVIQATDPGETVLKIKANMTPEKSIV